RRPRGPGSGVGGTVRPAALAGGTCGRASSSWWSPNLGWDSGDDDEAPPLDKLGEGLENVWRTLPRRRLDHAEASDRDPHPGLIADVPDRELVLPGLLGPVAVADPAVTGIERSRRGDQLPV